MVAIVRTWCAAGYAAPIVKNSTVAITSSIVRKRNRRRLPVPDGLWLKFLVAFRENVSHDFWLFDKFIVSPSWVIVSTKWRHLVEVYQKGEFLHWFYSKNSPFLTENQYSRWKSRFSNSESRFPWRLYAKKKKKNRIPSLLTDTKFLIL